MSCIEVVSADTINKIKTADGALISSSQDAGLVADPELCFSVSAQEIFAFELALLWRASCAAYSIGSLLSLDFTGPDLSGASGISSGFVSIRADNQMLLAFQVPAANIAPIGSGLNGFCFVRGVLKTGANPGSVGLRIAQTLGNAIAVIANAVLASNVVTLTVAPNSAMPYIGQSVVVAGISSIYNGTFIVTAITATTFSYAKTHADDSTGSVAGTASLVNPETVQLLKGSYISSKKLA